MLVEMSSTAKGLTVYGFIGTTFQQADAEEVYVMIFFGHVKTLQLVLAKLLLLFLLLLLCLLLAGHELWVKAYRVRALRQDVHKFLSQAQGQFQ